MLQVIKVKSTQTWQENGYNRQQSIVADKSHCQYGIVIAIVTVVLVMPIIVMIIC